MATLRNESDRPRGLCVLGGLLLALATTAPAEAQFGFGGFGGYGFYPRAYTPPSVSMLNRVAVTRAGMDQEQLNRTSLSAPQDRYAYRNQTIALQQRYDVESTRGIEIDRRHRGTDIPGTNAAPSPPRGPGGGQVGGPTAPRPVLPLTSFVNDQNQVVWPADAPITGDLGPKRDQADAAISTAAEQFRAMSSATVSTVARARQELLNYGRPALQEIRQTSTARVADTFHLFLLSLYDSLAQAAEADLRRSGNDPGPPPPID